MNFDVNEYSQKIIEEITEEKFSWHTVLKMFELYALTK